MAAPWLCLISEVERSEIMPWAKAMPEKIDRDIKICFIAKHDGESRNYMERINENLENPTMSNQCKSSSQKERPCHRRARSSPGYFNSDHIY